MLTTSTTTTLMQRHQTLADFTVQHSGTMEALFAVALLNGASITDEPVPGALYTAPLVDQRVRATFIRYGVDATTVWGAPEPGGIGSMRIGSTFRVS